jgi:hypothetical protein
MKKPNNIERQNELVRKMLLGALLVGAKTPREAFDIANGKRTSYATWHKHRAAWERNWQTCVEIHQFMATGEGKTHTTRTDYPS